MAQAVSRWPVTSESVAMPGQCTQCHSPVSTIPPLLHTHLHINTAVSRRTNGRSLGTVKKKTVLFLTSKKRGAHKYRTFSHIAVAASGWLPVPRR